MLSENGLIFGVINIVGAHRLALFTCLASCPSRAFALHSCVRSGCAQLCVRAVRWAHACEAAAWACQTQAVLVHWVSACSRSASWRCSTCRILLLVHLFALAQGAPVIQDSQDSRLAADVVCRQLWHSLHRPVVLAERDRSKAVCDVQGLHPRRPLLVCNPFHSRHVPGPCVARARLAAHCCRGR